MTSFIVKIDNALTQATRDKNEPLKTVLRDIKSKLALAEKEHKTDYLSILKTMVKTRSQSIEIFENAGRIDLVQKEKYEKSVIEQYLPKQMSEDEIEIAVRNIIKKLTAVTNTLPKIGMVMKEFSSQFPGQNGKIVSEKTMEILTDT